MSEALISRRGRGLFLLLVCFGFTFSLVKSSACASPADGGRLAGWLEWISLAIIQPWGLMPEGGVTSSPPHHLLSVKHSHPSLWFLNPFFYLLLCHMHFVPPHPITCGLHISTKYFTPPFQVGVFCRSTWHPSASGCSSVCITQADGPHLQLCWSSDCRYGTCIWSEVSRFHSLSFWRKCLFHLLSVRLSGAQTTASIWPTFWFGEHPWPPHTTLRPPSGKERAQAEAPLLW